MSHPRLSGSEKEIWNVLPNPARSNTSVALRSGTSECGESVPGARGPSPPVLFFLSVGPGCHVRYNPISRTWSLSIVSTFLHDAAASSTRCCTVVARCSCLFIIIHQSAATTATTTSTVKMDFRFLRLTSRREWANRRMPVAWVRRQISNSHNYTLHFVNSSKVPDPNAWTCSMFRYAAIWVQAKLRVNANKLLELSWSIIEKLRKAVHAAVTQSRKSIKITHLGVLSQDSVIDLL